MEATVEAEMWVFGYGSLLWKPCFEYKTTKVGYIEGYVRRMWQGSVTHRGTRNNPGRVANLERRADGRVWGAAFRLVGPEQIGAALEHLTQREVKDGGYRSFWTRFTCRPRSDVMRPEQFRVFCYAATSDNELYAGPSISEACVIAHAKGPCGHNVEYLIKLTGWLRAEQLEDPYLTQLEECVVNILRLVGVRDVKELVGCRNGQLCAHCVRERELLAADDPVYGQSAHGLEG